MSDVTRILSQIESGDPTAAERLLPMIYEELRKLASAKMAQEKPGQTLQATALVHEAYLRLVDTPEKPQWESRGHFFAAAAEAMRRILVENARRKQRLRHGGQKKRINLDQLDPAGGERSEELLALNDALDSLAQQVPEAAEVVKLRHFAGLTAQQAADALGISLRTANRHWAFAKAWLLQEMRGDL